MSNLDQTPSANGTSPKRGQRLKWLKISAAAVSFLMVLVVVFVVSNRMAAKQPVGFPAFQDSAFVLTDQDGVARRADDFVGQPIALFFGFTYCPDICPTTLMILTSAQDQLAAAGHAADNLQILFVTVDPERDTPAQLQTYLSLFDAPVTGLTGSPAAIQSVLKHFGIYAKKTGDGDDYLYDHSAAVFLYRADGNFKGTIVHNEPGEFIVEKLKSIL